MEVINTPLTVDIHAEKIPATIKEEITGWTPACKIRGTIKSVSVPVRLGKDILPVTPHHSISVAENHIPKVPNNTALNITL